MNGLSDFVPPAPESATAKKPTVQEKDYDFIRRNFAKGSSDDDFKLFIELANRYELDPMLKQIWYVKYGNSPAQVFAGRDGFLDIAHRSGQFDGMHTTLDRDDKGNIVSATCEIWRKDSSHSFICTALMDEYNTHKSLWYTKPGTMIIKVAESQCLRKAFSISGLYDPSEMDMATETLKQISAEPELQDKPAQNVITGEPVKKEGTEADAMKFMQFYVKYGFNTEIFGVAKLRNGNYDIGLIEEDYIRQQERIK